MLQLVTAPSYADFAADLLEMHRLRFRVFKGRLSWDVETSEGLERDSFDDLQPTYILQRDREGCICGSVRLLPTTGPTMLRDTFPELLHGTVMPASPAIWESSRFAIDVPRIESIGAGGNATLTYELLVGVVEFGLAKGLREIVTVTDARMERILRRANWPLRRIGDAIQIGDTRAVAGFVEISRDVLNRLRSRGGLKGPALWSPVVPPAIV